MLDKLLTSRWWYPAIAAFVALILLTIILAVGSCGRDRTAEKQAEQTAASGRAANAAGAAAVNTAASVAAGEAASDAETRRTMGEINESHDPDAVRNAVLDRVCKQDSHRLDPACRLRRSGAR